MTSHKKLISLVTPVYNENENSLLCRDAIKEIFEKQLPDYDYEHIFCDNNSTDGTQDVLRDMASKDKHVKVIYNARNFGPFASLFNGVLAARGDAVLLFLAADLQDPPELIPDFVKKWEEGYEVVYGIRKKREESLLLCAARKIYYRALNRLSDVPLLADVGEFQLVDRKVVEALKKFDDYAPYLRGLVAKCGFKSIGFEYTWKKRKIGKSKINWYSLTDIGLNAIVSFSKVPLRIFLMLGFLVSLSCIGYSIIALIITLYRKMYVPGYMIEAGMPTLIVGVAFLFGVQLFVLGLIGEYVGAIHAQVRRGPLVIERERINFD